MNSTATLPSYTEPHTGRPGDQSLLARYTDRTGRTREIVRRPGAKGSTLVIERSTGTGTDARLLAHLGVDEPIENARIVCGLYLSDPRRPRCRALRREDFLVAPLADAGSVDWEAVADRTARELVDDDGNRYELGAVTRDGAGCELRWRRLRAHGVVEPLTLRAVIGAMQSYEPARALTYRVLASCDGHRSAVSASSLRVELQRLEQSSVVLNRGLREAVLSATARGELTLSEIAIRCGRIKRDDAGNESGETSWLARRIGTLPEAGKSAPTPWVHSDVLALIARDGLGVAPRDVELP